MEGGKGKDLMPCSYEIAIPIVVNGRVSDTTMQGGDSNCSATSESGSNSHSNASQDGESNGKLKYSESLRRRSSSKTTNSDSSLRELEMRRPSMTRPKFSQTKSRVMEVEQSNSSGSNLVRQGSGLGATSSFNRNPLSVRIESLKMGSLPPAHTHEHGEEDEDEDDDEEDEVDDNDDKKNVNPPKKCSQRGKINLKTVDAIIEWIVFVGVMVLLIASLCVYELKIHVLWGLEIWKWCVLVAVFFCGRLVTKWTKDVIVLFIESKFLFNEKVVYFVHGVKQSVRVVIWLAFVLLAWGLLVDRGVERTRGAHTIRILNYITKALISTLIGAVLWMLKTLLVKLLAASFHVKTFFEKIREAISHEYVFWILSMPRPVNSAESDGGAGVRDHWCLKCFKWRDHKENKDKEGEITIKKLGKMKPGKMPVSTMGHLIDRIRSSKLSVIAGALDTKGENGTEQREITCRSEAEEAASIIFQNVKSPKRDYIKEVDLLPFMNKENVDCLHEWFEKVAEARRITKTALTNWAVSIYKEREFLSHSLKDAKTAIEELNRILSGVVLVLIIIVWLLLMGFATTKVLLFCSSQVLLVVFIFGNSCRTLFEAMIFVFVMHPFDVGDRCVIDGVQMIVEEMDILKTTFLRYDNEMIYIPNAVLATKAISNFNRSPERMGDNVNFDVDVSTSSESIENLREKIKEYIQKKSEYWHPEHSIQIKEIEDMNRMKMILYVNHKMNFQDFLEKMNRRTELMLALKKIFEDLGIKYHLLPQEVHISYVGSAVPAEVSTRAPHPRSVI